MVKKTDILIIGGGSAGFGAAYRAVSGGNCTVTLVEKNPGLGGTSTYGGVNCWEPGYGGNGVHHLLAQNLQSKDAACVAKTTDTVTNETPWGVSERCTEPYDETLERSFRNWQQQRRFQFEPQAMSAEMLSLLQEKDTFGKLDILFSSVAVDVEKKDRAISSVTVSTRKAISKSSRKLFWIVPGILWLLAKPDVHTGWEKILVSCMMNPMHQMILSLS